MGFRTLVIAGLLVIVGVILTIYPIKFQSSHLSSSDNIVSPEDKVVLGLIERAKFLVANPKSDIAALDYMSHRLQMYKDVPNNRLKAEVAITQSWIFSRMAEIKLNEALQLKKKRGNGPDRWPDKPSNIRQPRPYPPRSLVRLRRVLFY